MKEKEYDFNDAEQGAIVKPARGKTRITIRIDTDILNWFRNQIHKAGGGNYQTLINDGMCQWKLDTLLMSLVYFLKGYFLFRLINPGSHRHAWRFR